MNYLTAGVLVISLLQPVGAAAQDGPSPDDEGRSLISRGFNMMMEGLFDEAEPALDDLREFAESFEPWMRDFVEKAGPAMRDLMAEIGDLSLYEAPERLPNGDIILRRKEPLDQAPPRPQLPVPEHRDEIEL